MNVNITCVRKLHRTMSEFKGSYLVTVSHMSSQGQFDVCHMNSSVSTFLKAHDVIEDERIKAP